MPQERQCLSAQDAFLARFHYRRAAVLISPERHWPLWRQTHPNCRAVDVAIDARMSFEEVMFLTHVLQSFIG
ncbi:MAG TPA: hypothetical protein VFR10_01100 [bacterium]|nr:hypothetical protein [bacterium]